MKRRSLIVSAVVALAVVFLCVGVYATQQAPDTMTMDSKVFAKHTKTLVTFNHKKHNVDYKLACTECHHHFEGGKNVWKEGDEVKKCDVCHTEAKAPTGKEAPKLSKKEEIQKYYFSAIHENCVGCHKDLKKAAKPTGPTACKDCHPAKK
jgi:hypothetical protein